MNSQKIHHALSTLLHSQYFWIEDAWEPYEQTNKQKICSIKTTAFLHKLSDLCSVTYSSKWYQQTINYTTHYFLFYAMFAILVIARNDTSYMSECETNSKHSNKNQLYFSHIYTHIYIYILFYQLCTFIMVRKDDIRQNHVKSPYILFFTYRIVVTTMALSQW